MKNDGEKGLWGQETRLVLKGGGSKRYIFEMLMFEMPIGCPSRDWMSKR